MTTLISQFSRLSDLAYDAAENGNWEEFLSLTEAVLGSTDVGLITGIPDSGGGRPQGQEHEWGRRTSEWYPDPTNDELMERTWRLPRGRMLIVQNLATSDHHDLAEHYKTFLLDSGLNHLVLALLPQERQRVSFFTLTRGAGQPAFSDEEIAFIEGLILHMRRALRLADRRQPPARENLFAKSPYGLVFLDDKGACVTINDTARDLVAKGDGISAKGDSVEVSGVRDFKALVASLVKSSLDFSPAIMRIERSQTHRPIAAILTPPPVEWSHLQGKDVSAVLILDDPEQSTSPELDILMSSFGLTRSEARLARALVETRTLKAAGAKLGIAPETARHHIKSVFHKTHTHSQAELVRVLVLHPTALFAAARGSRPEDVSEGER